MNQFRKISYKYQHFNDDRHNYSKETDEIGEYNRPKLDIEVVWNTPYINIADTTDGLEMAV